MAAEIADGTAILVPGLHMESASQEAYGCIVEKHTIG